MDDKAKELRPKLDAEIKAGKSFADAAKALGLEVETLPACSMSEPPQDKPDAFPALSATQGLKEGQLSELTPASDGGLIVFLQKRHPLDEKKFEEQKPQLTMGLRRYRQMALFSEWLSVGRESAKIQVLREG